jgi:predicted PurR-regulated permease PerM
MPPASYAPMSVPAPPDRDSRVQVAWPGLGYWARATVVIVLVVGVLLQLRRAADVFVLVLMALVLAVGLDPAVRFLERRGLSRGLATAIIFVSSTIAFAVFLWFGSPSSSTRCARSLGTCPV